jgi:hypothetical protein
VPAIEQTAPETVQAAGTSSAASTLNGYVEVVSAPATSIGGLSYFNGLTAYWTVPQDPPIGTSYLDCEVNHQNCSLLQFAPMLQSPAGEFLMPILQWGYDGQFWEIQSWYCGPSGCSVSPPLPAKAGDAIEGQISINGQSPFVYTVSTYNLSTSVYTYSSVSTAGPFNTVSGGSLYAERVQSCDQFPLTNPVQFSNIQVYQAGPHWNTYNLVAPTWSPWVAATSPACGYGASATSSTATLRYRALPAGTTLCGRGYKNTSAYFPSCSGQQPACGQPPNCSTQPGCGPAIQVDYVAAYNSATTRWCVDLDIWDRPGYASGISQFFAYGDTIYSTLQTAVFNSTHAGKFTFQVYDIPCYFSCAHTGTDGFGDGDTVPSDAFITKFPDPTATDDPPTKFVTGYGAYLLTLHEMNNDFFSWTAGTGGWPTDWMVDHRSPFPVSVDYREFQYMGTHPTSNPTMTAVGTAVREVSTWLDAGGKDINSCTLWHSDDSNRGALAPDGWYSCDPKDTEVTMFDTLYTKYGGFAYLQNTLKLVKNDALQWNTGPLLNPSELLTEYVIAYLQLGIRTSTDLSQTLFVANGVGCRVCGSEMKCGASSCPPGSTEVLPYSVSSSVVRAIGTAHCSIAAAKGAGKEYKTELTNLQQGNYAKAVASGGTQAKCPAECRWSNSKCIAKW